MRLAAGLYRIGSDVVNSYLVEDPAGITIIDTPSFAAWRATSSERPPNSCASRWQWVSIHMISPQRLPVRCRLGAARGRTGARGRCRA